MNVPTPTRIFRITDIDNLKTILMHKGIYAPNFFPKDGSSYRCIHNPDIQNKRLVRKIPCGIGGVVHDYAAFYFGSRSPMLLQLHTGQVPGYTSEQAQIIYLTSTVQRVKIEDVKFVFSDGHGNAKFTQWFDNVSDLSKVDWDAVKAKYWRDTPDDMDRQRRKQAEFLIHKFCSWDLIENIGVFNQQAKLDVESIFSEFPENYHRPVKMRRDWYYD